MKLNVLVICLHLFFTSQVFAFTGFNVGCKAKTNEIRRVKYTGKLLLNKEFLSRDESLDLALKEAAEYQIKHLNGFFRTTKSKGFNVALSSYRSEIKIKNVQEAPYSVDTKVIEYLSPSRTFRTPHSPSYVLKALERSFTKASDPGLLVSYETDLIIASCSDKNFLEIHNILLPLDPYLSLWIDDQRSQSERFFNKKKSAGISSCHSSEIIEWGSVEQSWYFWSPIDGKLDMMGKTSFCKVEKSKIFHPNFELLEKVREEEKPFPLKDESLIKFSAIFGIISRDSSFKKIDLNEFSKKFVTMTTHCRDGGKVSNCLDQWERIINANASATMPEPGFIYFLSFLKDLNMLVDVTGLIVKVVNQQESLVEMKGYLRDSRKPIELSVYYGKTNLDYGPKISKTYASLLHSAFKDSTVISYLGHSGLGANMSIENLETIWRENKLDSPIREKPLWIGYYSCEGFSYFGFDVSKIFHNQRSDQKLYLSMSTGVEAHSRLPLSKLLILDRLARSKGPLHLRETMYKYVGSKNFYVEFNQ